MTTTPRVLAETTIGLTAAAASLPGSKGAGRCARFTVARWITHGVRGVKLEGVKVGGSWKTSREAVARFLAATTAAAGGHAVPERTPAERAKTNRRLDRELAAAGW